MGDYCELPPNEIDEILDCGDDLAAMEQTAFMSSSKTMLSMIDNMLMSIDSQIVYLGNHPEKERVAV